MLYDVIYDVIMATLAAELAFCFIIVHVLSFKAHIFKLGGQVHHIMSALIQAPFSLHFMWYAAVSGTGYPHFSEVRRQ